MIEVPEGLRAALAGRYDLERELGHGAMATVYLARDVRFDRWVAVKVLNRELAAALGAERFLREIEILARLNHPHILPLLDSGETGGFLYYVMPYVDGETLRHRLHREVQLPLADALAIAREVALALDYAHRQGFIHRDIKPENVLLSSGFAIVADFGIARAVDRATESDHLTGSGVSPGTPPYMSPEQASGNGVVGNRSDIYALGCVLYEMLAGQPPFPGPTAQAVMARHLADPVPPLRTVRRTVSPGLEQVVLKALEKVPADRYATGAELAAALEHLPLVPPPPPSWRVRVAMTLGAAALIVLVTVVGRRVLGGGGGMALDSTRYLVLPPDRDSDVAPFHEEELLQDALQRWSGVTTVDAAAWREEVARYRQRPNIDAAASLARRAGAGRFVLSETSHVGDSLRVHAAVYVTGTRGPPVAQGTVRVGLGGSRGARFATLAERLLFGEPGPGAHLESRIGTTSRPARLSFARGLDSVFTWNLAVADSAFNTATRLDPQFPEALLWLALVRSWTGAPVATWQSASERAVTFQDRFSSRDRVLAEALLAQTRQGGVTPCSAWSRVASETPDDFAGWYGLANCLRADSAVVRDPKAASGWRFRSSYERAIRAFQRAFRLLPSTHSALRDNSYAVVRKLFMTDLSSLRKGVALPPDSSTFVAYASWVGDSLTFIPYPAQEILQSSTWKLPPTTTIAVSHERQRFHDLAVAWTTAYPQSSDARVALALSLDMLGDHTALDTLRLARALARRGDQRLAVTTMEVWMRLRSAAPMDLAGVREARRLADSLLRAAPLPGGAESAALAGLALLLGRAGEAVPYLRAPVSAAGWPFPRRLVSKALPLLGLSALGGPRDSLIAMEGSVEAVIEGDLPAFERHTARLVWLARAASLAFPDYRFASLPKLAGEGDYLLDAEVSLERGDSNAIRKLFEELKSARRYSPPSDLPLDAIYPEARLLEALGDDTAAIAWIDPVLASLSSTRPDAFGDLARAGVLVRAMVLRADLAARVNDVRTAKQWATCALILLDGADAFLQPTRMRMSRLTQ